MMEVRSHLTGLVILPDFKALECSQAPSFLSKNKQDLLIESVIYSARGLIDFYDRHDVFLLLDDDNLKAYKSICGHLYN